MAGNDALDNLLKQLKSAAGGSGSPNSGSGGNVGSAVGMSGGSRKGGIFGLLSVSYTHLTLPTTPYV